MSLKPNHFNNSVLEVCDKSERPEQAINWLTKKQHQHYFESYYNIVANDIRIQGICKDTNNTTSVNLLHSNEHDLQHLIQETNDNTHGPMLYQLSRNNEIPMYESTLPIHRNSSDIARMETL